MTVPTSPPAEPATAPRPAPVDPRRPGGRGDRGGRVPRHRRGGVYALTSANLVGQMDERIDARRRLDPPRPAAGASPAAIDPEKETAFGPVLYVWTIHPDGATFSNYADSPRLPVDPRSITSPQTLNVAGTNLRVTGEQVGARYVVAGESMEAIEETQSTLTVAMLAIAPFLIAAVFFGAVLIGRRVAAPDRGRTPAPARVHRRRLARAAHAALRDRGAHEPGARGRSIARVVPASVREDRARGPADAPPARRPALARAVRCLARRSERRAGRRRDASPRRPSTVSARSPRPGASGSPSSRRPARHVVSVPPEWLDRLLGVLLDNACRYSPEGGTVTVRVEPDGSRVRLAVDDSGPGIAPEERDRIFDRFHRATEKPGGAGLGLAIGDAIVRATNGRWRIGTSPAGGASMSVNWPRALTSQPEPGVPAPRTSVAGTE